MQLRITGLTASAIGAGLFAPGLAHAQTLDISVTIPRLTVAEYHRPYVAIWLEQEGAAPKTLAVWYDDDMKANEGTKWLRDVRQWWRASGRAMKFPAAGVSGATKAPGTHKLSLKPQLGPGNYTLVVEAAREVGGRELVRLPFSLPKGGTTRAAGSSELGAVALTVKR
ncbi:DUF2271 domain-containing protein [Sphingomonas sp. MG17]|uniref:DUF2271 domain-containing protein n=1 Tax=Sphingomonas tagetis TaxID=2949092 RepID=A0A9X2KPC1_9SPHN|nr:DUF2271 domain-containing protein [Sphingomonas tagetis]MCP3730543.1 DUF2271 domain-containing protein [Sphingomonas tagetis]